MSLNPPLQDVILVWLTPFNSYLTEWSDSYLHQGKSATTPLFFKKMLPTELFLFWYFHNKANWYVHLRTYHGWSVYQEMKEQFLPISVFLVIDIN